LLQTKAKTRFECFFLKISPLHIFFEEVIHVVLKEVVDLVLNIFYISFFFVIWASPLALVLFQISYVETWVVSISISILQMKLLFHIVLIFFPFFLFHMIGAWKGTIWLVHDWSLYSMSILCNHNNSMLPEKVCFEYTHILCYYRHFQFLFVNFAFIIFLLIVQYHILSTI